MGLGRLLRLYALPNSRPQIDLIDIALCDVV
jgi:hypothetical protein